MACTLTAVPYAADEVVTPNLIPTASFEYAHTGWSADPGTGGTAALVRSGPFDGYIHPVPANRRGGWFLRQSWTVGTSDVSGGPGVLLTAGITPGLAYSVSAEVRASKVQRLEFRVQWLTAGGAAIGGVVESAAWVTPATGLWERRSFTLPAAPALAAQAVIKVRSIAGASGVAWVNGDYLDLDAVMMVPATYTGDYFDGDHGITPGVRHTWTGTEGASISWRTVRTPRSIAQQVTPDAVLTWEAPRASATVLHDVIGRPDPLPALGPLRARRGEFDVWCPDEATAHAVVALYALGRVVMLTDPDHPDLEMYHVATRVAPKPVDADITPRLWTVAVEFAEVYGTAGAW